MKINKAITSFLIQRNRNKHTGFTLTELLVAMLLGILVLIAASSLFFSSHRTHRTTDAVSRIQEQQRLAFELMARDIRNAGSFPCRGMDNLVFLHGRAASSDWAEIRYHLASSLIGNYYEIDGVVNNPDGTQTVITSEINKHKDERFDTIYLYSGNSIENNAWNYPVIEHRRPDGDIKALNLDKLNNNGMGMFVICNAETAIVFDANPNTISGDSIKITTGMEHNNLCGGGFTRNPNIATMSTDCDKPRPLGPSYCFWGDMTVTPTEEDKAACDEIGQSQAYIFNFRDLIYKNLSMWYVDNIDTEHKGDLFNDKYGKVAEGITSLQLRYRLKGSKKYIDTQMIIDTTEPFDYKNRKGGMILDSILIKNPRIGWSQIDSVHLKMTFQTPDKVGTDGKALERTMETYIAIRSRMPEIYNEYAH